MVIDIAFHFHSAIKFPLHRYFMYAPLQNECMSDLLFVVSSCVQVLMDMLIQSKSAEPAKSNVVEEPPVKENVTLTYDQLVKDLIEHEKAYIRELNMISKVFRNQMLQIPSVRDYHRKTLDEIFSNIDEVYDFSVNLLGSLEDTIEVTKENESPAIGSCFEELAEVRRGVNGLQWGK